MTKNSRRRPLREAQKQQLDKTNPGFGQKTGERLGAAPVADLFKAKTPSPEQQAATIEKVGKELSTKDTARFNETMLGVAELDGLLTTDSEVSPHRDEILGLFEKERSMRELIDTLSTGSGSDSPWLALEPFKGPEGGPNRTTLRDALEKVNKGLDLIDFRTKNLPWGEALTTILDELPEMRRKGFNTMALFGKIRCPKCSKVVNFVSEDADGYLEPLKFCTACGERFPSKMPNVADVLFDFGALKHVALENVRRLVRALIREVMQRR